MIEPTPYVKRACKKQIAVVDTETDPFLVGRVPVPFTVGFYDGDEYRTWWGDDCIAQFFAWLSQFPKNKYLIFAHNGGKFDFLFMREFFDPDTRPFIMDGRLVQISIGGQEFRDSYSILPVPLGAYKKDDIDYAHMEKGTRNIYREEILSYMRGDCVYLYELVTNFFAQFGDRLTMAGVALPMLRSFHGYERLAPGDDLLLRPYFFGGRCQAFETGLLRPHNGTFKIFDRNSMYPTVMAEKAHPVGSGISWGSRVGKSTRFVKAAVSHNEGAFCFRHPNGSLDFTICRGDFFISIHELQAAEETGTARINRILETVDIFEETTFAGFVHHFYTLRQLAASLGDEILKLFWKLVLNSSYGKFALDPREFEEAIFDLIGVIPQEGLYDEISNPKGWLAQWIMREGIIWTRDAQKRDEGFINVATAASITGASRADLLRAICGATRPIYCDTDSVICENLAGVAFGEKELGAWKTEAEGDTAAIAGKKLYAVFNKGEPIKKASKGVQLTADEIKRVASGEVIEYANPAPKMKLDGGVQWINRQVRKTG